jgi:hypothetical protein
MKGRRLDDNHYKTEAEPRQEQAQCILQLNVAKNYCIYALANIVLAIFKRFSSDHTYEKTDYSRMVFVDTQCLTGTTSPTF